MAISKMKNAEHTSDCDSHVKGDSVRYRKIDPRVWKDEKFFRLNPEEKLIALYVITAQSNRIGLFSFSSAMACEELGMDSETFAKRLRNVELGLG